GRPFQRINHSQRYIDGVALCAADTVAAERVRLAAKGMYVTRRRALGPSFTKQFRVRWKEAFERGPVITGEKRRDQVIGQPDVKRMAPKRRPVLLAKEQQGSLCKIRC